MQYLKPACSDDDGLLQSLDMFVNDESDEEGNTQSDISGLCASLSAPTGIHEQHRADHNTQAMLASDCHLLKTASRLGATSWTAFDVRFQGKTVVDIGCGTGVMCCLAAKAGAARVIGCDTSHLIPSAQNAVEANGLSEIVTLLQVSDLKELTKSDLGLGAHDKVDIFMSFRLCSECMFDNLLDVLRAWELLSGTDAIPRISLPQSGRILFSGWSDQSRSLDSTSVASLKSCMRELRPEDLVTTQAVVWETDFSTCLSSDCEVQADFELRCTSSSSILINGFVATFDADLAPSVTLDGYRPRRALFQLSPEAYFELAAGAAVNGHFELRRISEEHRAVISWNAQSGACSQEFLVSLA